MSGDIRAKLASSEAAESLRMERSVAQLFKKRRWPAEQGIYYTDPATGKGREIDVISRHTLQRPNRHTGVGSPLINLTVICECKSLSGWNVLFLEGEVDIPYKNRMIAHWSGYDEHIRELVEWITKYPDFANCDKTALYSYFRDSAYPDDRELGFHLKLRPPPIGLVATAFRETKGGDDRRRVDGQPAVNPLWNAIQSVISATKAAEVRALELTRSWTMERSPYAYGENEFVHNLGFFFDAELTRHACFHPVIFCKAKLFKLTDNDLEDVDAVRIYINDLDFEFRYVDVVNFDVSASYIGRCLSHFEAASKTAIHRTWDRLEALQWNPGQKADRLAQALGLSSKFRESSSDERQGD